MLKEIIVAIAAFGKAHQFIIRYKLWNWVLLPGIIYMLLFVGSMYFFGATAKGVVDYLIAYIQLNHWTSAIHSGWLSFLFSFAGIVLWLLLLLFYFSLFKYIWLILGAPFFALLSEKTAALMQESAFVFSWKQWGKDIWRGIKITFRNCLWQSTYTIVVIILSVVPIIGWVSPLLAMFIECYYCGFGMLDYSCERRRLSAVNTVQFIGQRKGLAIGNGLMFYLLHLIPILGWILAPSYAAIAATISIQNEILEQ